ncbi:4Fe-4S cluster-binding domain-containing protein [Leptospira langatensis]|uniref:7-carboxy-7-deazaguanine synthase n=1 Tax=Leptospira langatensis TaxID=2484983 RepID=A0A5F1ZTC2_9LEPT|nr:7-carboxy-7-deazaguanine synthase QueE [Leptospira langatensis]TGK02929.1 4Fe-4S cluster-binding domain-containing protein [Leptospira langatensis]TGL41684.1 4Fe-4S cluster-binding domain-containing protein [Leptospira langatensis]
MKTVVHEIYLSVSGEGISTGLPTIFVRFAGCSLRCGMDGTRRLWCDTPYALSPNAGKEMDLDEALAEIRLISKTPTQILLTGGEPLEDLNRVFSISLAKELRRDRESLGTYTRVRVETNGAQPIRDLEDMVFTLDYKLPGSGMEDRMIADNVKYIRDRKDALDEIKFVIRDRVDFDRTLQVIDTYSLQGNLLASPVFGELHPETLVDWIKEGGRTDLRLSLQTHKYIWGDKRGV